MIQFVLGLMASLIFMENARSGSDLDKFFWRSDSENTITVNVPLELPGKKSTYKLSASLSLNTETLKESQFVEHELSPVVAEFENVPSPRLYQFIHIENDDKTNTPILRMISFLCSGETPIGGEALSGKLLLNTDGTEEDDNHIFISTGRAAEDISVSHESKLRSKIFDRFLEIYEERALNILQENDSAEIYIPDILAGLSGNRKTSVERNLFSIFFKQTNSSVNGCSGKFVNIMQDLLIENVAKEKALAGVEVRKKLFSDKYKLKVNL